jgi:peptidoglycan/LPS O-acetylase OafA/YrhL
MNAGTQRLYANLSRPAIPSLNGIRALAVILVILHHLGITTWDLGSVGVIWFFVLSGFLITWLLLKEHARQGRVSLRNFYIRRALRLLPAFYAFFAVYVGLTALIHRTSDIDQYVAAALYFNDYYRWIHPTDHLPMDHTWSLAVEEQFYLLWPAVALALGWHRRKLTIALISVIVAVAAGRVIYQLFFCADHNVVYYSFHTRADSLAIGCLVAVLLSKATDSQILDYVVGHWSAPVFTLLLLALTLWEESRLGFPYQHAVGLIAWPLLLAVLTVQAIAWSDCMPWRLLNLEPLVTLGAWSYGAYLWHWPVDYVLITRFGGWSNLVRVPVAAAISFGLAAASYYLIERRFLRLKKRFSEEPIAAGTMVAGQA